MRSPASSAMSASRASAVRRRARPTTARARGRRVPLSRVRARRLLQAGARRRGGRRRRRRPAQRRGRAPGDRRSGGVHVDAAGLRACSHGCGPGQAAPADAGHVRARALERVRRAGAPSGCARRCEPPASNCSPAFAHCARIRRAWSSCPGARLACDRVVHLPLLSGPNCPGRPLRQRRLRPRRRRLPGARRRRRLRRRRRDGRPYKQGGLAAQQADVGRRADRVALGAEHPRAPTVPSCAASCGPPMAPATCAPIRPGNPRRPRSPTSACGGRPARSRRAG